MAGQKIDGLQVECDGLVVRALGLDVGSKTIGVAVSDEQVRALIPSGARGSVEDIAGSVCFLASDDAGYITGHSLVVDGGWRAK